MIVRIMILSLQISCWMDSLINTFSCSRNSNQLVSRAGYTFVGENIMLLIRIKSEYHANYKDNIIIKWRKLGNIGFPNTKSLKTLIIEMKRVLRKSSKKTKTKS